VPQPGPPPGPAKRIGPGLLLDLEGRLVSADGEALDLTRREFDLLAHLSTRPGRVLTRAQLLTAVWGLADARHAGPRTVDVHVARLRRKLGVRHGAPLSTLRGVGYRWSAGSRVTGE
jgi:DNA-binding response OmpR family regulator